MRKKLWIIGYLCIVVTALSLIAFKTISVDPFFHFHAPKTDIYYYRLNNQRSQNDGITRNFDYEGIITGTSMTENFKTSEAEVLFGVRFIKVPYSGGSFKEINSSLERAALYNQNLKYVIRSLEMYFFCDDKDRMRTDLGQYPDYLYDDNLFNDVKYIFNRDVLFTRVYPMTKENDKTGFKGGIPTFDDYSNWMAKYKFGYQVVLPDGLTAKEASKPIALSQNEIERIKTNVRQNVTAIAEQHPNITFYCFFAPFSAVWWRTQLLNGKLDWQIDTERVVIEELLKHDNIKLFSFNTLFDITTDLNNYKDATHYGEWVNSLMLRYMYDGKCQITRENFLTYLETERQFYGSYDYTQLINQEDYEDDYLAAAIINDNPNSPA